MNVYIETGTYTGDTLYRANFPVKYSIEYDYNLFLYCKNRFIKDDNVTMIHGDSGEILEDLLLVTPNPAFVFLDASTSTTSVLIEELEAIMKLSGNYYTIAFDKSTIGKTGKYGEITLEFIQTLVSSVYFVVIYGGSTVMLIQKSGSERSASECSSSDSL
jgi:hypothetical protein